MAAGTAQAGAPPAARGRSHAATARLAALGRATSISRVEAACILLCLTLAALTLLFPTTPTYDPWSWIVWGRQILHGSLDTVEGPSWKPLPIFFTVPFSIFGEAAPNLWVVIARAGAMLSLGAAFSVARRLVGGWAGVFGGLFAAFALLTALDYVRLVALGNSEGILVLVLLVAIDRHLQGRFRHAFFFAFLAGLLRPEAWPFLLLYGVWLLWRERAWLYVLGLGAVTVFLWLAPERWGSGNFFRAADRATDPTQGSAVLAFAAHPFSAVFDRAEAAVTAPVLTGLAIAAVAGVLGLVWRRSGFDRRLLALAAWPAAWVLLVAVMTVHGFSGNPRYLVAPVGIACAVAGAGWGALLAALARVPRLSRASAIALAAVAALGIGVWAGFAQDGYIEFRGLTDNLRYQAELRDTVPAAIAAAGGRGRIIACGRIATNKYQVPMLSWYLHVPGEYLKGFPLPRGYMFQTVPGLGEPPDPGPGPDNHRLGRAGPWTVFDGPCKPLPAGRS